MKMKWTIGILVAGAMLGGGAVAAYFSLAGSPEETGLAQDSESGQIFTREVPAGQKEYRSAKYSFSVLYPEELKPFIYEEGGDAQTIAFEDASQKKGFQVFIVPFTEEQITEERFRADIPSGVREELKGASIDSATGATFYSRHEGFGETYEVWFVHEGYLYEVNAPKNLDTWLDGIIQTWQFI